MELSSCHHTASGDAAGVHLAGLVWKLLGAEIVVYSWTSPPPCSGSVMVITHKWFLCLGVLSSCPAAAKPLLGCLAGWEKFGKGSFSDYSDKLHL